MDHLQDERFLDVNQHGVLRIPGPVWLGFAFLARHWLVFVAVAVSARRDSSAVLLLGHGGIPWLQLLLELPIVLLAFAGFSRHPGGGSWVRFLWRHGRELVLLQAAVNVARMIWLLANSSYWLPWPELFLASCALIDLAIVVAMYQGTYFRQLFLEFPAPEAQAASVTRTGAPS